MYDFHGTLKKEIKKWFGINRNGELKTLSITQSIIEKNKVTILHHDLIAQENFSTSFITI
jgi:hypothetical protein